MATTTCPKTRRKSTGNPNRVRFIFALGLLLGIYLYLPAGGQYRWRVALDRIGLGDEFDAMSFNMSKYWEYVFDDQPTSPFDNPSARVTTITRCILNGRDIRDYSSVSDSWDLMVIARARSRMYTGMINYDPADSVLCIGCTEVVLTYYRDGSCAAIYRNGTYLGDYSEFGVGLIAFEGAGPDEPAGRIVLIMRP